MCSTTDVVDSIFCHRHFTFCKWKFRSFLSSFIHFTDKISPKLIIFYFIAGFFWAAGPSSAQCVLEVLWWTDWHPPSGGTRRTARYYPQAAQTLEGQRLTRLNTLTNCVSSLEVYSWNCNNLIGLLLMIKLYTSSVAAAFSGFAVVFSVSFGKHLIFVFTRTSRVKFHLICYVWR